MIREQLPLMGSKSDQKENIFEQPNKDQLNQLNVFEESVSDKEKEEKEASLEIKREPITERIAL